MIRSIRDRNPLRLPGFRLIVWQVPHQYQLPFTRETDINQTYYRNSASSKRFGRREAQYNCNRARSAA